MGIKQQAWRDLLTRYNAIFRHAWQRRKEMDPPERLPHEAQFLPATLALQETPVHPAPRMAMGAILLFAIIALLWAVLGHVDVVATATGKVIPDSRSKVIQPMETANIHAIYVKDGQAVKIGDPLIDLDATAAQADVERLENDLSNARYERTRAIAMLDAIEQNHLPMLNSIPDQDDTVRLEAEQRLILGQYQEFRAKVDQLDAEISRREAERRSVLAIVEKIQQTLPIAKQRSEDYKNLLDKNFVSKHGYLQMEQARIEQERDLAAQKEKQAEILASRIEAERQKGRLIAETKRELLDQKHKATQLSATLEQELLKAENRGKLLHLTAPVEGTVQQLAVHTVG
ncbi:MAG: HlyD family type I secretion periplasmic adaptor subunit, partial [Azovibrio sp.]